MTEVYQRPTDAAAAGATFSADQVYRYLLTRRWGNDDVAVFIMHNPSTADAFNDDPTIRRCIGFAKREGCGGLVVVNLYALRATDPAELQAHPDPVGPKNDKHIEAIADIEGDGPIIAAWGVPSLADGREAVVAAMLERRRLDVQCLGFTRYGHPRHPLYLSATAPLRPWGLL